jgi:hypothetical protein
MDIPNYNFEFVPTPLNAGGVGMYIDNCLKYIVVENISNEAFQALWIEISLPKRSNIICGVIYRQHNSPESFLKYFEETIETFSHSGKIIYIMGDININPFRFESCNLTPTIDKPTRVYNNSATLIDNIFVNKLDDHILSGNIISDISDHFSQFRISIHSKRHQTRLM